MVNNISAGFLQAYVTVQSNKEMTSEEMFKRLSFEMGGDGKTITKDQLDKYIEKAEGQPGSIDKSRLSALKKIQGNWDTISKGEDSISFDDMKDYTILLAQAFSGSFSGGEVEDAKPSAQDFIYAYLTDALGLSSKDEVTKSDLTSYLNELVANSLPEDDFNDELIGTLTNLIASHSSSTVEQEA